MDLSTNKLLQLMSLVLRTNEKTPVSEDISQDIPDSLCILNITNSFLLSLKS